MVDPSVRPGLPEGDHPLAFGNAFPVGSPGQGGAAMTGLRQAKTAAWQAPRGRWAKARLAALVLLAMASAMLPAGLHAQQSGRVEGVQSRPLLPPDLDGYIAKGMKTFDVPGLAI